MRDSFSTGLLSKLIVGRMREKHKGNLIKSVKSSARELRNKKKPDARNRHIDRRWKNSEKRSAPLLLKIRENLPRNRQSRRGD